MAEVRGARVWSLSWMDSVKVALGNSVMAVEAAQQCSNERKKWRALVYI